LSQVHQHLPLRPSCAPRAFAAFNPALVRTVLQTAALATTILATPFLRGARRAVLSHRLPVPQDYPRRFPTPSIS
jgi:hypothetical protein